MQFKGTRGHSVVVLIKQTHRKKERKKRRMVENFYVTALQLINTSQKYWNDINDPVQSQRRKKLAELQKFRRVSFHGSLLQRTRGVNGFMNLSSSVSMASIAKIGAVLGAIILVGGGYLRGTDLTTILVFIIGGICVAGV